MRIEKKYIYLYLYLKVWRRMPKRMLMPYLPLFRLRTNANIKLSYVRENVICTN